MPLFETVEDELEKLEVGYGISSQIILLLIQLASVGLQSNQLASQLSYSLRLNDSFARYGVFMQSNVSRTYLAININGIRCKLASGYNLVFFFV